MNALDVIDRLKTHERERIYLFAQLDLWAQVQAQGIEPETVATFGFDPGLLTGRDQMLHRRGLSGSPFVRRLATGRYLTLVHNYVRLKDGTIRQLTPLLNAVHRPDDYT